MFCSRNKGADKTVRCVQADLRMLRSRGTYICKRVVNKANFEMSGFTDFKFTVWAVKALVRRLVRAFATRIAGLFHEIKYLNIKFIKMQDCATINLFLGTCMCVCAYINSLDPPFAVSYGQTRRDRLNSLLKFSILRNLMFLIDMNSHYYMYLENR